MNEIKGELPIRQRDLEFRTDAQHFEVFTEAALVVNHIFGRNLFEVVTIPTRDESEDKVTVRIEGEWTEEPQPSANIFWRAVEGIEAYNGQQ